MKNAPVRYFWILLPALAFGLIYALSGTNVYVEGDDAASVAYHVMGRDHAMQPVYSPYHGMMDVVLSVLPPQENLVRTTAFGITRWATLIMFVLMLLLVFDWLQDDARKSVSPAFSLALPAVVLLSMPEFFYLGLVYAPTVVAMCFILAAHMLLRYAYRQASLKALQKNLLFGLSVLLFGLGAAFRWNTAAYLLVIVADILSQPLQPTQSGKVKFAIQWARLALLTFLMMIFWSGYRLAEFAALFETVLHVMNQAGVLSPDRQASLTETILRTSLNLTPLLTPAALFFMLIGLAALAKKRSPLLIVVLAGLLSALPWFKSGVPKFIITAIPGLILLGAVGLSEIIDYAKEISRLKALTHALLVTGLLIPWLVGIRITREESSWGPGFEVRRFDDQEVGETSIEITLGPGMAFPTPEGARPLYGHAFILLGGWKPFVEKLAQERQGLIETALRFNLPIVVTSWSPDYYLNNLYNMGFHTTDNYQHADKTGFFIERRFTNPQGRQLSVLYSEMEGMESSILANHLMKMTDHKQVLLVGYTRTMHNFYLTYPNAIQATGTNSALIDLERLRQNGN